MNDTLTPVRSLDQDRKLALAAASQGTESIALIDRLTLRVGLWLLLRGTRRITATLDREAAARLVDNARSREARERAAERAHHLLIGRF